jgi:Mrp family chromosome partitioning ATPase
MPWYLGALVAVCVFGGFEAYARLAPATYRTTALIIVEPTPGSSVTPPSPSTLVRLFRESALSPEALASTAVPPGTAAETRRALEPRLSIEARGESTFAFSLLDSSAEHARDVCNALASYVAPRVVVLAAPTPEPTPQELERRNRAAELAAFIAAHPEIATSPAPTPPPVDEQAAHETRQANLRAERDQLKARIAHLQSATERTDNPFSPEDNTEVQRLSRRVEEIQTLLTEKKRPSPPKVVPVPVKLAPDVEREWLRLLAAVAQAPSTPAEAAPPPFAVKLAAATLRSEPIKPNRRAIRFAGLAGALLAGFGAGLTLAFLRGRTAVDIERESYPPANQTLSSRPPPARDSQPPRVGSEPPLGELVRDGSEPVPLGSTIPFAIGTPPLPAGDLPPTDRSSSAPPAATSSHPPPAEGADRARSPVASPLPVINVESPREEVTATGTRHPEMARKELTPSMAVPAIPDPAIFAPVPIVPMPIRTPPAPAPGPAALSASSAPAMPPASPPPPAPPASPLPAPNVLISERLAEPQRSLSPSPTELTSTITLPHRDSKPTVPPPPPQDAAMLARAGEAKVPMHATLPGFGPTAERAGRPGAASERKRPGRTTQMLGSPIPPTTHGDERGDSPPPPRTSRTPLPQGAVTGYSYVSQPPPRLPDGRHPPTPPYYGQYSTQASPPPEPPRYAKTPLPEAPPSEPPEPRPRIQSFRIHTGWSPDPSVQVEDRRQLCQQLFSLAVDGSLIVGVTAVPECRAFKSRVAAELALGLAEPRTARVLLMEADFQWPAVHQMMRVEMPMSAGLSQQLRRHGQDPTKSWTMVECSPSLHVLAEGVLRSPGLILSTHFEDALRAFRSVYDFIIIDGPQTSSEVDCRALDFNIDGLVMVSPEGGSPWLSHALGLFSEKRFSTVVGMKA